MSESNNKNKNRNKAVALRYRTDEDAAPVVIASGYGAIADKIVGIAEEKGIPIYKDDSAASMLCMLEVGRNIPPELYEVIATIYMQILSVSKGIKKGTGGQGANVKQNVDSLLGDLSSNRRGSGET